MKVAVISPNLAHLDEIAKTLRAAGHQAVLVEGGKSRLREVAQHERPDIAMVEGMCHDPAELAQVEQVTSEFPQLAVVLLCASSSPEFLINSMRAGVREVLPSPVPAPLLHSAVQRLSSKLRAQQARVDGRVLAFMSAKGGSGATFLATNVGSQLAAGKSVLVIDLNLQFGDALAFVHDGKPASTLADVARDIGRLDASFLAASTVKVAPNFQVLAAPEEPSQAVEIKPEEIDAIISLASAHYDFVLLDLGRSIDSLSVKALDRAETIFTVLQASVPALRNARKMLGAFKSLGYAQEKAELIVNRFEKSGEIGVGDIERALGKYAIHLVPNAYKVVSAAINHGDIVANVGRNNPVSRNLAEFARALTPQPDAGQPGLLRRLLNRA
jgi:pilus assembly protein CpaE